MAGFRAYKSNPSARLQERALERIKGMEEVKEEFTTEILREEMEKNGD